MSRLLDARRFSRAARELADTDAALGSLVASHGIPEFWHRPPGFGTLVLLVLEQQVSLASARATFERLRRGVGSVTPRRVLAASDVELRAWGLSRQKARYVRVLAEAVTEGRLDLEGLETLPDDAVRATLTALPGIGPWTADVYLLSSLRRPDIWPVGDRALQVAAAETLMLDTVPDPPRLARIGERWAPWRAVAARLLWHGYLMRRGRRHTPA